MNVTSPRDLIDALRRHRMEMGVNQEAVAAIAGLSAGRVGLYERRAETPRLPQLMAWLGALGLALEIVPAPPQQRRDALLGSTALTPPGRVVAARPAPHLAA